jgi:putative spermidine/putrescine transport system permease protein
LLRGEGRVTALLLLPLLGMLAYFFVYPIGRVVWLSFTDPEVGLGNYAWFFGTDVNVTVLIRTFVTAVLVTGTCLALGYPYAYLMVISRGWVRAVLLLAVLFPLFTSTMARVFAWVIILQNNGVLNWMLDSAGFAKVQLLYTTPAVVLGMAQVLMPLAVLPMYATMARIDLGLLRAAESLGARPSIAWMKVFVPLSLPGVMSAILICIVTSTGFYLTPALLGSPRNTLLPVLVQIQVGRLLEWGRGGAMAVVLLVSTLVLLGLLALVIRRLSGATQPRVTR